MNVVYILWQLDKNNPNHYYTTMLGVFSDEEAANRSRINWIQDKFNAERNYYFYVESVGLLDSEIHPF